MIRELETRGDRIKVLGEEIPKAWCDGAAQGAISVSKNDSLEWLKSQWDKSRFKPISEGLE